MESNGYKVLIVDDEKDITEFLSYNLKKEGFSVYIANDGKSALEVACEIKPHLILLDIMMPEMDGIEVCERIREIPAVRHCIIAFLTARTEDYSQIAGFEAGGDDYIAKPIKPKVLISRIYALLKRTEPGEIRPIAQDGAKEYGNIIIDSEKYMFSVDGNKLYFTKKEFTLLLLLTSRPAKVFTREEIIEHLWGNDTYVGDRTLDVHIRKLREKLGDEIIKTIKGVGYKFEVA